jgi:hypothetical protein
VLPCPVLAPVVILSLPYATTFFFDQERSVSHRLSHFLEATLLISLRQEIHEELFGPGFSVFHNLTVDQLIYLAVSGGSDGHMLSNALPKVRPGRPGWRTRAIPAPADNTTGTDSAA